MFLNSPLGFAPVPLLSRSVFISVLHFRYLHAPFDRTVGIPSYNDVREAYGLSKVTTFEDVTSDVTVQGVLEGAYGKVELLDAYT